MITKDNHSPHSGPASYGVLENALLEANALMSILEKSVDKIGVTGKLKHKYINGYTEIELLAVPKKIPNFLGHLQQTTEMHELLRNTVKNRAWISDEPPTYEWQGERYRWKLTTLKDISQWTIAQIIHTGPDYFSHWLMASTVHRQGALPWGYSINDYNLINNNGYPIAIKTESEFWETLDYLSIPLADRHDGDPRYWRTFKRV